MSAHGVSFTITRRDARGIATNWHAVCGCKQSWDGKTYEVAEDEWRMHVRALTGQAPRPCGNLEGRWTA